VVNSYAIITPTHC